jgi:predicted dehydrogenase
MANNSAVITDSFKVEKEEKVNKKLRWAIVGCGGISQTHMGAIKKIPQIEVVGCCDIKPDRLKVMKDQWGIEAGYEKWDDLLREIKPDVIDVCTPNGVHCPAVVAAVEAGCHAITEKPMAMNPAECQQMIDAAKANDRKLAVGFQYRYHPVCEMFTRAKAAGDIGDIMFVKCQALRRRGIPNWGVFGQKELQGGGPMIDIGVHIIESAHYCIGEPRPIAASGNIWTYIGDKPSEVESMWPGWDWKTFTVEDLAIVIFKEKIDKGQTWTITNMVPEQEGEFTLYTNLNNGAPDLQFKVINKAGTEFATDLNQKGDKIINIISDPDSLGKLTIQLEDKN